MLSLHGILVCSIRGLLSLQKCFMESYFTNKAWDIFIAQIQPYLNVYALKIPLVYQYLKLGGEEKSTKIEYTKVCDLNSQSRCFENTSNLSIRTFYKDYFKK